MIVAIHQPNLFPWLGFFDKMRQADLFVLLDCVPFIRRGYQHRVHLKTPSGPRWLTVPVIKRNLFGQITKDVTINHDEHWQHDHRRSFEILYRRATFFDEYMAQLGKLYERHDDRLVEFTIPGIMWLRERLSIDTEIVRASRLNVTGVRSELLLALVQAVGGTVYLSGPSGRQYLETDLFDAAGIGVLWHKLSPFEYDQLYPPFASGLSTLDYLFNVGAAPWWQEKEERVNSR